jgi:hypothetical protein
MKLKSIKSIKTRYGCSYPIFWATCQTCRIEKPVHGGWNLVWQKGVLVLAECQECRDKIESFFMQKAPGSHRGNSTQTAKQLPG